MWQPQALNYDELLKDSANAQMEYRNNPRAQILNEADRVDPVIERA